METPASTARSALEAVLAQDAWAAIRFRGEDTVSLVGGPRSVVERLRDVPLEEGAPAPGRRFDRLLAVPFRQAAERGFAVHDDGTPLVVVRLDEEHSVALGDLLVTLPDEEVGFVDRGGFETTDEDYAATVEQIIDAEIGNGEGANLVVGRTYRARLREWGPAKALTVFRRLLERESGAYWTFCFFTGDRYLVGASPERHVSVHGGDVRMNPISGTFRLKGLHEPEERRAKLLEFLADEKEIYELFMVVDEELKMMCDVCEEGGQVLGPYLKPMTHLVHTEYLLAGRTGRDVRDVLRDTMYAATVTGSPVRNACRLITRYERTGRGYYGAALALIGRDPAGSTTADAPIVIRTADVSADGRLSVTAGATLVRDSQPDHEVAETHAKAAGILSAFGLVPPSAQPADGVVELTGDEDVLIALGSRNQRLSRFWLTDQSGAEPAPELAGKTVGILDGDDDFVKMLGRVFSVMGMQATVLRHQDYTRGALDEFDLAVVGPGPGDPRDADHPKVAAFAAAVEDLRHARRPFLAVCLGHQVLCRLLGLDLGYKDIVFQGTQSRVRLRGHDQVVGFYNTFVARADGGLPEGVSVETDEGSGDVHLVAGPHYRGIQFHAESILTEHGYEIIRDFVLELLPGA